MGVIRVLLDRVGPSVLSVFAEVGVCGEIAVSRASSSGEPPGDNMVTRERDVSLGLETWRPRPCLQTFVRWLEVQSILAVRNPIRWHLLIVIRMSVREVCRYGLDRSWQL